MAHSSDILQELMEQAPQLARVSPVVPYTVPAKYFEDFASLVLMRLKTASAATPAEELEVLSPLLSGLKKEMPFSVPQTYFEKLIVPPLKNEATVRHMSFPRRAFKYAAAAVIAGLIGLAVWFGLDNGTAKNPVLAEKDSVTSKDLDNISDTEMENFLDGNISTVNFEPAISSDQIKAEDIRLMLAEVSDKELENYLN